ncbi:MAG: hypothetical protein Q9218_007180 [Villophora microphyllina]
MTRSRFFTLAVIFSLGYMLHSFLLGWANIWPLNVANDPDSFGWITKWTVVGDSKGAGTNSPESEDNDCSRYSGAEQCLDRNVLYPGRGTCQQDLRIVISRTEWDEAVIKFCKRPSNVQTATIGPQRLDLRLSKSSNAPCDHSDCAQSLYSLYQDCIYPLGPILEEDHPLKCFARLQCLQKVQWFALRPDAMDPAGSTIEPVCSTANRQYIPQPDIDTAVNSYCDNDGKAFFKGDKQFGHTISTGPKTHVYTEGTDIAKQTSTYYRYDNVCK